MPLPLFAQKDKLWRIRDYFHNSFFNKIALIKQSVSIFFRFLGFWQKRIQAQCPVDGCLVGHPSYWLFLLLICLGFQLAERKRALIHFRMDVQFWMAAHIWRVTAGGAWIVELDNLRIANYAGWLDRSLQGGPEKLYPWITDSRVDSIIQFICWITFERGPLLWKTKS